MPRQDLVTLSIVCGFFLAVSASAPLAASVSRRQAPATRQVSVESLIYDLKNPDPIRRREAVTALGVSRVQRAAPDLVALSNDPDASVRRALVLALPQLGDLRTLPGFVTLSADSERDIRDKAIEGLTNLYLPQESGLVVTLNRVARFFNPWSDEWAEVLVEPDLKVDPSAIDALQARLEDADDTLRSKAARSLGILRGRSAVPSLVRLLREDRSDTARFEAARALRKIGDAAVGGELVPLVPINSPRVRGEIVYTLGRLRYREAVPELTSLLDKELDLRPRERDRGLAYQLLGALAFIGSPESKPTFERFRADSDTVYRLHAFEGLARLAKGASPEEITRMASDRLGEKDARVRAAQDFALYRMGRKEHLGELVNALTSRRANTQAREYLLEFQADELANLYPFVSEPDVNLREALAEILGLVGDESSLPPLRELVRDTRGQTSALAAQAIRRVQARTGAA